MTKQEMEQTVSQLLLKQREFRRLGLELPPDKLMLLKRLLYRLGLTRMSKKPKKYMARPHVHFSDVDSLYRDSRHRSGLNIIGRELQKLVSVHPNRDVRVLAEQSLKGQHNSLKVLQDKLTDLNDPRSRWNLSDLADFANTAHYRVSTAANYIAYKTPLRETDSDKRLTKLIDDAVRVYRKNQFSSEVYPMLSVIGSHLGMIGQGELGELFHKRIQTGEYRGSIRRLSGETKHNLQLPGGYQIISREGDLATPNASPYEPDKITPITWVSIGKPHPQGKKNLTYGFVVLRPKQSEQKSTSTSEEPTPMSRSLPKKSIRFAKADKNRHPAHYLVAGFPIEHALRHLANDAKNSSNIRDLAKVALTGGDKKEGAPEALWMLNDALQEHQNEDGTFGHPLHKAYNWMSAADKVQHDAHTYTALTELANHTKQLERAPANSNLWHHRPEGQAQRLGLTVNKNEDHLSPQVRRIAKTRLEWVKNRVKQLSPNIEDKQIEESIQRHAHRAGMVWRNEHGSGYDTSMDKADSIKDVSEQQLGNGTPSWKNEKATRYARNPLHVGILKAMADNGHSTAFGPQTRPNAIEGEHPVYAGLVEEITKEMKNGIPPRVATQKVVETHFPPSKIGTNNTQQLALKFLGRKGTDNTISEIPPTKYARLTIGKGEPLMGGADYMHEIHDETGNRIGHVWVTPMEGGQRLHINHVGAMGHEANSLGPSVIRDAMRQLRTHYPNAKRITGNRITGAVRANTGGERPTERNLSRRKYARTIPVNDPEFLTWWQSLTGKRRDTFGLDGKPMKGFGQMNGVKLSVAAPFEDWLQEQEDWRHWLLRGIAEQETKHISSTPIDFSHRVIRPERLGGEGKSVRLFRGKNQPQLATWVPFTKGVSHMGGGESHVWFLYDENDKPIVHLATSSPDKRTQIRNMNSLLSPQEYESMRQEASTAGINFPEAPETHRHVEKLSRLPKRRFSMSNQGTFIDSLRKIKSSNQKAMHETATRLAKQLGLEPTKILNALHDSPHGSVPGIAQAIYGHASPEQLHAAAAWIGLTSNVPGVAVFHARSSGPDMLYRIRQEGAGMDIRTKLDRFGLKSRILIPHKKGFDVLIPDKGNQLGEMVNRYVEHHKLNIEASPGHFNMIGSQDQARARDMFRGKVEQQERMSRKGVIKRYSENDMGVFHKQLHTQQRGDKQNTLVYADYIEEEGKPHHADIIRSDPETQDDNQSSPWETGVSNYSTVQPGEFTVMKDTYYRHGGSWPAISLVQRSLVNPDRVFWWVKKHDSEKERDEQLNNILQEGAKLIGIEDEV